MTSAPEYGTGALLSWDAKNELYPVAAVLDPSAALVSRAWRLKSRINQGSTPKCVGASLGQELAAEPVEVVITQPGTMDNIYRLAQELDEWPGNAYEGTSLLAGLKALKQFGYIGEYRWASNAQDVAASLSQLGPVTMAGPWLTGMFTPDREGRLQITGTAGNIGHCYLWGEIDAARGIAYLEQTWGPNWSVLGWRAWAPLEDLDKLFRMGSQAAIITSRMDPAAPAPPLPPPPVPPAPTERLVSQIDVYSTGRVQVRPTAGDAGIDGWSRLPGPH